MTNTDPAKNIEHRFHDLSADVREERVIRYIVHQVEAGRRVNDIVNDDYIAQHFDEASRNRILEHPEVIKSIEQSVRRQFAGEADAGAGSKPSRDQD